MEFDQAARVLPQELRQTVLRLAQADRMRAEEIRLRVGQPVSVVLDGEERELATRQVCGADLERLVELASRASLHTVMDQLRGGFITVEGGHRVGLCGTAILRQGSVSGLRGYSSANVRVARCVSGAAKEVLPLLCKNDSLTSTLIAAPPGAGKTTLLRDVVRSISNGEGCRSMRVSLVDERGEVAALQRGCPQLPVGKCTDVLEGCPKAEGLLLMLRAMNPQVLAADEITVPEDVRALRQAAGCGAVLLATAHAEGKQDLERRAVYRELLDYNLFERLVVIRRSGNQRRYEVEVLAE